MPEIRLSIAEQRISTKRINDVIPEKGLKIFFGIGGSRDTKRWPAEHFANLARTILKQFDAQFVFTLVPGDSEWVENFKKYFLNDHEAAKRLHFFKDLTLREAAGVISKCDYYVGNDSSLKHIAIAFDLPTFTFFGPEEPLEWHPYHISHHPYAFIKNLECRTESGKHWCTISSCVKHKHQCLAGIVPESVLPIILSQCEKIQDIKLK